jgi:hypothetical protein
MRFYALLRINLLFLVRGESFVAATDEFFKCDNDAGADAYEWSKIRILW